MATTALNLLDRKIEELLIEELGRNFYERIAEMLQMAADLPLLHREAKTLAIKIYSKYSRLTALDELKTAGLVKL